MDSHTPTPATDNEGRLTEWLLRGIALIFYGVAVSRIAQAWIQEPDRWTLLLLLLTEGLTLLVILFARKALARNMKLPAIVASVYSVTFFVLLDVQNTQRLVPEVAGVASQLIGVALQFTVKATLGRSFGILPARRGLVMGGPYRLVRHPIYLGYLISHFGFLLTNASLQNLLVLASLYAAQIYRIDREEALLAEDPLYSEYRQRVRWKLLPGIF